jgi:hypothetical protein
LVLRRQLEFALELARRSGVSFQPSLTASIVSSMHG